MRTLSCPQSYNIRSSFFHTVWWTDHLDWRQFSPVGQSPPWVCSESSNTDKNRLNEKDEKKEVCLWTVWLAPEELYEHHIS